MFTGSPIGRAVVGGLFVVTFVALLDSPVAAQGDRGPGDYADRDQNGRRYRDQVFNQRFTNDRNNREQDAARRRARFEQSHPDDEASFSESYPYVPTERRSTDDQWRDEPPARPDPRITSRYRRPPDDGLVRNDYAGAPVYRHYYGGSDRYDSPGYLDGAGRASALANGYSTRGVEEFQDAYGRGVRTNDVYPLQRNVDPRRYRGRDLNGSVTGGDEDTSGARDLGEFVRSELSVRPGANLRVSSTGTYTFRNYLDQGNQVHARFRAPVHRRWEYVNP